MAAGLVYYPSNPSRPSIRPEKQWALFYRLCPILITKSIIHFEEFFFLICFFCFCYLLQQLKDEIAEVTAEMESLDNTGEDR